MFITIAWSRRKIFKLTFTRFLFLKNNGNLEIKYPVDGEQAQDGMFMGWQSGSGTDMDLPTPYENHLEQFGYQMCKENQKKMKQKLLNGIPFA